MGPFTETCSSPETERVSPNCLKTNDIIIGDDNTTTLTVRGIDVENSYAAILTAEFGVLRVRHDRMLTIKKRPKPPIPLLTVLEGLNSGSLYVKTQAGWVRIRKDGATEHTTWTDDMIREPSRRFAVIKASNGAMQVSEL